MTLRALSITLRGSTKELEAAGMGLIYTASVLNLSLSKIQRDLWRCSLTRLFRLLGTDQFIFLDLDLLAHQDEHFMGLAILNQRNFFT